MVTQPIGSEATMNPNQYCAIADVTDRTLVKSGDVLFHTPALNYAITEASRLVDTFLNPYTTVPFTASVPDQVVIATADFAASIFKRRLTPKELSIRGPLQPDMINDVDGQGWFALGLKKLLEYIKNFYAIATSNPAETSGVTVNPTIYKELFKNGVLTLKEARAYMANADSAITEALNKITTLENTETHTITKTIIERTYPTKAQRSFGFISGQAVGAGGYNKDSDSEQNQGESP